MALKLHYLLSKIPNEAPNQARFSNAAKLCKYAVKKSNVTCNTGKSSPLACRGHSKFRKYVC